MAESTNAPSLPSTADTTPYVPVSWMAVAALTVAASFAATLLALSVVAFTNKKPLLEDWLLAMPAIAIVLSFAARRVIRNSEGTRTGEHLANYAWWTALVLGLCYVAYLFAIDFAIRRDARAEAKKWMDQVAKGTDDDLDMAFLRTIPPGARQGISATDKFQLRSRFRDELLAFRTCDLLKIAQRNRGELEFSPGAVNWSYKPGTVECVLQGTVKCPEGTFPIVVPLKGVEGVVTAEGGSVGRQWMITRPPASGFIDQARATRTAYGWLLMFFEIDGGGFGKGYVSHLAGGPSAHTYAYRAFVVPGGDRAGWSAVAADQLAHLAFAVPARAAFGDAGYAEYMDKHFYKAPGGAEPSADQKARFLASWNAQGLRPAGDKLKDAGGNVTDKEDLVTVTDSAIEVRVPVEIPVLGTGKIEVARGRLVVACTDPAVLAEVKQLKASANPAQGTSSPPEELMRKKVLWRVVRVESDMLPVNIAQPGRGPGGPGGPGGMDGPG
jgi:hypothetical protein